MSYQGENPAIRARSAGSGRYGKTQESVILKAVSIAAPSEVVFVCAECLVLAELRSTARHHKSNDWYLLNDCFARFQTFRGKYSSEGGRI